MLFKDLDLCPEVLAGIQDIGFEAPTEIQEKAIPFALEKKNLLATSATGSGKTAAFAIPILNNIYKSKKTGIQALILAPTRELAKQIDEQFWSLGYHTGISSVTVYGGGDWSEQERALKGGVNIVVATPGRLMDHMKIFNYDFSNVEFLVLDEADRMLDMGFIPDVRSILNRMPKKRQSYLFSATMNADIERLAAEISGGEFERIKIGIPAPAKGINQVSYHVEEEDKLNLLVHLYETQKWSSAIVFASTKRGVDQLSRALQRKGAPVESIHGDRDQKEREQTLEKFKKGVVDVLIATDVMARGIDVDNITHIINYDVPNDLDDYIHRIGRTARAENTGDAITFVTRKTFRSMKVIYDALEGSIKKMQIPEEVVARSRNSSKERNNQPSRDRNEPDTKSDQNEESDRRNRGNSSQKQSPRRKPASHSKKNETTINDTKAKNTSTQQEKVEPQKTTDRNNRKPKKKESTSDRNDRTPRTKQVARKDSKKENALTPEEKRFQKQEALIQQVQQSSMPTKNASTNEIEGGFWTKVKKKLFS